MPTVLLADDHRLVRLSVREDLEQAGFRVCAEAGTAGEAIDAAIRENPDLCLLDVSMPGGGLFAAAEIRRHLPAARVVMLTASDNEEHFLEAVRAGACGYLLKDGDPLRFPTALRDVLAGVPAFPRRLTRPLVLAAREVLGPPKTRDASASADAMR
jgi:two-component system nitrate/nitrite response regulator NarL